MKEYVIFDVDNTIVKGQSQFLFLNFLYRNKYLSIFYYIKVVIWFILYKLNIVNNPSSIMKYAFHFAKGKRVDYIDSITEKFFDTVLIKKIFPEIRNIINEHKRDGHEIILVSNAVDILVKKIAIYLNINEYISTKLEIRNGIYTGDINGDIIYGENKVEVVNKYLKSKNILLANSWAYADHTSDLSLLSQVAHPFAVNPTTELEKIAKSRNWPVLKLKT